MKLPENHIIIEMKWHEKWPCIINQQTMNAHQYESNCRQTSKYKYIHSPKHNLNGPSKNGSNLFFTLFSWLCCASFFIAIIRVNQLFYLPKEEKKTEWFSFFVPFGLLCILCFFLWNLLTWSTICIKDWRNISINGHEHSKQCQIFNFISFLFACLNSKKKIPY